MANEKVNTADREIFLSRIINAPVELVWEVWTKPEHIANWWGPSGFSNTINSMNVKPGGEWNLVMHGPDGTDYPNRSVFKEIIPLKKIVYEHTSYPPIVATIQFASQGAQTLLTWHMLFETAEQFIAVVKKHNAAEGQKENVEKLIVYLAKLQQSLA